MSPLKTTGEVFDSIQAVKAGAVGYCTNFFPVERKLRGWIDHGELLAEFREGAVFFFRKDRDFWHLYFCAADVAALRQAAALPFLQTERTVLDLVGNKAALAEVLAVLESAGFRRRSLLQRMARPHQATLPPADDTGTKIEFAEATDCRQILDLLDSSFDRYADQLPIAHEIEEAVAGRQVLVIKCDGVLAALLHFETQGMTSTIRYWVVAEAFRSRRFGAALMRHYLALHSAVRRFILWVVAANQDAVQKYQHYGYTPDGLVDHVLANALVS